MTLFFYITRHTINKIDKYERKRHHLCSLISLLNYRHVISALFYGGKEEGRAARTENMIKDSPMWEKMDF